MVKTLYSLLKVNHWIKNTFIFIPAFFGGVIINNDVIFNLTIGFFTFSLAASSIYIINDIKDINFDKNHPKKSKRPIASGKISIKYALSIFVGLVVACIVLASFLPIESQIIVLLYFILNIFYSLKGKQISIVDITIVSLGFVFRIAYGGVISEIIVSKWLFLLTFLLSLFLVVAKRRDDLVIDSNSKEVRTVIKHYNLDFINYSMIMISSLTVVCYIMYTFSTNHFGDNNNYLVFCSSLLVILGILRYYQITFVENNSGSPTSLMLNDNFIRIILLLWVSLFAFVIYF